MCKLIQLYRILYYLSTHQFVKCTHVAAQLKSLIVTLESSLDRGCRLQLDLGGFYTMFNFRLSTIQITKS